MIQANLRRVPWFFGGGGGPIKSIDKTNLKKEHPGQKTFYYSVPLKLFRGLNNFGKTFFIPSYLTNWDPTLIICFFQLICSVYLLPNPATKVKKSLGVDVTTTTRRRMRLCILGYHSNISNLPPDPFERSFPRHCSPSTFVNLIQEAFIRLKLGHRSCAAWPLKLATCSTLEIMTAQKRFRCKQIELVS